ncbi:hypothetical protein A3K34_03970 [candidate division WWE3 bacterium RIFOXYC1_FULL_40_10]|uniref:R3H domain-containing protein n=1 Tax=candidate division WWE3 bacterium RIFOXYA2_FULL_46_9 TaxID=1802636 RepID=A0A1F4W0P9_UNCKA|nr:MAG: hypothetical protein A3K58_03970 [candidate division WWE3 bacterium RIFOXYB1_FULL_40_22]OGC61998.1 MAG: hypothetical protein A3K37_03970 [candidate division WWE3 bacterium RIFOXYA1_FULL_40_11]OGC62915.1 MAG: hypothetical protein A2264_03485 [candidate division WWE3 bacterium RIFOXYA2_FULL_46_9]OGC65059.1 MAG: hypothetical protein A2326_03410 [candidate division WWE3 bacterium RIFOXYB2_FULL_41_6]OGC66381.1 MAG: hypothetical protein A3K34_03970 [candidate division WWE3 bacterium RIFOXYC1_
MKKQDAIKQKLTDILNFLDVTPAVDIESPEENVFKIVITGQNLNPLIGFRGYSLQAMEHMLQLMLYRDFDDASTIVLDINGYKNQKVERIHDLAKSLIDKVRFHQRNVEMPPMNPWERRQVHMLVGEYDDIESESTGEGPSRRVVLKPKSSTGK